MTVAIPPRIKQVIGISCVQIQAEHTSPRQALTILFISVPLKSIYGIPRMIRDPLCPSLTDIF